MATRTALMFLLIGVLFVAISCMAAPNAPAHAQGAFVTPTPLPTAAAQLNAAQQRADAAQAMIDQANQMTAQAAEYLRNGIAQQQQAQQDIAKALAAVTAQNYEAIGEAIGQAKSDLEQLSITNAAQHDLITTLTDNQQAQASTIISLTNQVTSLTVENQRLASANQTLSANAQTLNAQIETAKQQSGIVGIPTLIVFAVCAVFLTALIMTVLGRRTATIIRTEAQVIEDEEHTDA